MVRVMHARFVTGKCDAYPEEFTGLIRKVTCEVCLLRLIRQQLAGVTDEGYVLSTGSHDGMWHT